MRIAVLGAGAMGSVYGGRLAAAGSEVWLVDVWREHVDAINRAGLRIEGAGGDTTVPVKATVDPAEAGTTDLVIVFVKSNETAVAVRGAGALAGPDTVFLTLQNGLGNRDIIASIVGEERTLAGVSYISAQIVGPGHVRQSTVRPTLLGEMDGRESERVRRIAGLLSEAGLPAEITHNAQGEIWGKLLVNAVANAACALTACTAGEISTFPSGQELVRLVAEETAAVASALGVKLPYPDPVEKALTSGRAAGNIKPSMLQDVEKGRWTEVDFINGAVVRAGEKAGVPTPYNRALTLLVRLLEAHQHGEERPLPKL